jgi:hypothetical protein
MSTDPTTPDGIDDPDLPDGIANEPDILDEDAVATGAAADSSDLPDSLKGLPRLLRYAVLADDSDAHVAERLLAEIEELCPGLASSAAWLASREEDDFGEDDLGTEAGLVLAAELDRRAAAEDTPDLRSLADSVRLLCLPMPRDGTHFAEHRRVAKALQLAFDNIARRSDDKELCARLEQICFGWAALPCCAHMLNADHSAIYAAAVLGERMATRRGEAIKAAIHQHYRERQEKEKQREQTREQTKEAGSHATDPAVAASTTTGHHLVVARLTDEQMRNPKLKEIVGPLKNIINVALPLAVPPPLHEVRSKLLFEFPYATEVIDFALADLVGRATVHLRPLLLVGDPGGGKSRFARRLGEVLGVTVWREDASRADGAVFGGTDRRWYSAEPCHPFLAIGQGSIANPMVLLDELEKAGTRADYGRLWDCVLGFLEPETNCRYPDPALQVTVDLSQVSYVATANALDPLPSPIRDRFRVITFPKPSASDLDALLPAVIADLARERGLDIGWVSPLDGAERTAVAAHWRGGSVRRLRRLVDAILRERDKSAARN